MKQLIGTVTEQRGIWSVIDCPDAPSHLRTHNLIPILSGAARLGDRVRLDYIRNGGGSMLWVVGAVLEKGATTD